MKELILTSTAGDPRNPKTWSGTPNNLIQALEKESWRIFGINSKINSMAEKLFFYSLNRALGYPFHFMLSSFARKYMANTIKRRIASIDCVKVLHTTTMDVSPSSIDPLREHYWMGDYTWNLWSNYTPDIHKYSFKNLQRMDQVEKACFSKIKHFFPISQFVRDNLVQHYGIEPERITVVGTGRGSIDPYMGEKNYNNGFILLVAKNRFEDKGGLLLLEAFKIAQRTNPRLQLVIVGDDRYKSLTYDIPNVTITGFIPWEQLQQLFNQASLYAMPALNEPWGLVYLEALACRTPLLGLNRNSLN